MKLTTALRNYSLDSGVNSAFDTSGILELRTGSMPTNAGDALTGTVLVTVSLPANAFANAANGTITGNSLPWTANASATGVAGYAVVRLSGDPTGADDTVRRMLLTVAMPGGGAEVTVQNTNIATGQTVSVTSVQIVQPAS